MKKIAANHKISCSPDSIAALKGPVESGKVRYGPLLLVVLLAAPGVASGVFLLKWSIRPAPETNNASGGGRFQAAGKK